MKELLISYNCNTTPEMFQNCIHLLKHIHEITFDELIKAIFKTIVIDIL